MRELSPTAKNEFEFSNMTGKDKFEVILNIFGTTQARDSFVSLCRQYHELPKSLANDPYGETYLPPQRQHSPPRQALLHNSIMDILKRLATQIKKPTEIQRKVLYEMAERGVTAKYIRDYFYGQKQTVVDYEDDDDHGTSKRGNKSEASFYHSLAKGE